MISVIEHVILDAGPWILEKRNLLFIQHQASSIACACKFAKCSTSTRWFEAKLRYFFQGML